jgi:hypothetical protein
MEEMLFLGVNSETLRRGLQQITTAHEAEGVCNLFGRFTRSPWHDVVSGAF